MKNFKKLIALSLTLMMLVSALCVMSVSAEGGARKFWVSHINKDDVYVNASVIFTEKFMKDNNYETLGDVTAGYKAKMGEEIAKIDPEWNDAYTDHKFSQYYTFACQWNAENARYEIVTAVTGNKCGEVVCPENGFILTMHADRDINGRPPHNYPSTAFGEANLGKPASAEYVTPTYWKAYANQPIYLYNIDVEAETIKTTGTFKSKMSAAGLANGLAEVYENFTSESYITVGGEDSAATVSPYRPMNARVSYAAVKKQMAEYEKLEKFDWSDASWTALENVIGKYKTQYETEDQSLDQETINAWANEIKDAIDALEVYDPNQETTGTTTPDSTTPENGAGETLGGMVESTSGTTGECEWEVKNGVLVIRGEGKTDDYGFEYGRTTAPWRYCSFEKVVVKDGVTKLGDCAFYGLSSLEVARIPESVKRFGDDVFFGCSELTIEGYEDSAAEEYADKEDIPFEELSDEEDRDDDDKEEKGFPLWIPMVGGIVFVVGMYFLFFFFNKKRRI